MPQVIIPNPVINSPFDEPKRHFYFDDDGITDKVDPAGAGLESIGFGQVSRWGVRARNMLS